MTSVSFLASNSPEVMQFLTAIGLDLQRVTGVTIQIKPGQPVVVIAEALLYDAHIQTFTPISNNYHLVPNENNQPASE